MTFRMPELEEFQMVGKWGPAPTLKFPAPLVLIKNTSKQTAHEVNLSDVTYMLY